MLGVGSLRQRDWKQHLPPTPVFCPSFLQASVRIIASLSPSVPACYQSLAAAQSPRLPYIPELLTFSAFHNFSTECQCNSVITNKDCFCNLLRNPLPSFYLNACIITQSRGFWSLGNILRPLPVKFSAIRPPNYAQDCLSPTFNSEWETICQVDSRWASSQVPLNVYCPNHDYHRCQASPSEKRIGLN